jgi:uncharacterized protein YggE
MKHRSLGGFLFLLGLSVFPLATSAQSSATNGQKITVTGVAKASGPVSGANVMTIVRGASIDANGLRDALTRAGVTGFIPDPTMLSTLPTFVGIRGRMPGATREHIDAVTAAVNAYVKAHSEASMVRIVFFGLSTDCTTIAAKARTAALADAHTRAEEVATSTGAHVKAIVSVTETKACPLPGPLAGAYQIDVQTLAMTVPVQETVTYMTSRP